MISIRFITQMKKNSDDQERQVAVAALAHHRPQDLVPDERDAQLAEVLRAARHQLRLGERGPEERHHDHGADQGQQHRLGEGEAADGEERREHVRGGALPITRRRVPAVRRGAGVAVQLRALDHGTGHDVTSHAGLLQLPARAQRPLARRACVCSSLLTWRRPAKHGRRPAGRYRPARGLPLRISRTCRRCPRWPRAARPGRPAG